MGSTGPRTSTALVPLRAVVHKAVSSCAERLMGIAQANDVTSFGSRAAVQRALTMDRIQVARALVVVRWAKTMNVSEPISSLFSAPEMRICAFQTELEALSRRSKLPQISSAPEEVEPEKAKPTKVRPRDAFSRLLLLGVPRRVKNVRISGKSITFYVPHEYNVTFCVRRRGFVLKQFSIDWPRGVCFEKSFLSLLTALLRSFESQEKLMLHVVDRILHDIHMSSQFCVLVKKIAEHGSSYNVHLRHRRLSRCVLIRFPSLFMHSREFMLYMKLGRILFASPGTMHLPPGKKSILGLNPETTETYDRDSSFELNSKVRAQSVMLYFTRDFDEIDALLGYLRDAVYYTDLQVTFQTIIHALRSSYVPYISVEQELNANMVTLGRITVVLFRLDLLTVSVQAWTGKVDVVFHAISNVETARQKSFTGINLTELHDLVKLSLSNVIINTAVALLCGSNINGVSMYRNTVPLTRSFSFGPDFLLRIDTQNGRPKIGISDTSGKSYSKPDIVQMDSSSIKTSWRMLMKGLEVAKRFILLAQVQRDLTEVGISSMLVGDDLDIEIAYCRRCKLSMSDRGWKVVFVPVAGLMPQEVECITKLVGNGYTARCARMIATLIDSFQIWRLVDFHVMCLSKESSVVASFVRTEQSEIYIRIANENRDTLMLSFGNNMAYLGENKQAKYHLCRWRFEPYVRGHFVRNVPLFRYFREVIGASAHSQDLYSFISHAAIPILEFTRLFGGLDSKWQFTNIVPNGFTQLVYKSRFTLTVGLRPFHVFVFHAPMFYPSLLLNCCLIHLSRTIGTQNPNWRLPVPVKKQFLSVARDAMATFCDLVEVLESHSFRYNDITPDRSRIRLAYLDKTVPLHAFIESNQVTFKIDTKEEITNLLQVLMGSNGDNVVFVGSVAYFVRTLLAVDSELLTVCLKILQRLRTELQMDDSALGVVMKSVKSNSKLSTTTMEIFYQNEACTLEICSPYSYNSRIVFQRPASRPEVIRGVDELFEVLIPPSMDFPQF